MEPPAYVRTVVCSCMQLYAVVCCCVLLCAVVFCCVLLCAVVCCCMQYWQVAKNQVVSDVMVNMKAPISIIKYCIGIIKNIASWIHKKWNLKKNLIFFWKKLNFFNSFFKLSNRCGTTCVRAYGTLYAGVCCCVLLCAVVCCCILLCAVVCCCMLLCAVVCCCVLLYAVFSMTDKFIVICRGNAG